MAKRWNKNKLKGAAKELKKAGSTGADGVKDTDVVHVNRAEKAMLKRYGGSGKTNPKTGLKEYVVNGQDRNENAMNGGNDGSWGAREALGDNNGPSGGKASGSNDKASGQTTVPTASKAPLAKGQALAPGGALAGASSADSLGDQGAAATPGDIPGAHAAYKPGDVPAVKGADAIGIGARVLGGIGGALSSGLSQAFTGEDQTEKAIGKEHFGTQVGWSGTGDEQGGRPGKTDQKLSGDTKAPAADGTPATSTSTTSSSTGASAAGASDGGTVTVNPDGTVRTTDTSVAGLRAQRRYGAKTAGA